MKAFESLLKPDDCVMLLIDFQAGLAFGVESKPRQVVLNNAVALARTAGVFTFRSLHPVGVPRLQRPTNSVITGRTTVGQTSSR
jgi:hypothetical protein